MEREEKLRTFGSWLAESRKAVFFGGAGVSTESGLPDFRSPDGLYSQTYDAPPEEILSGGYFYRHTDRFYRFYWDKMVYPDAKPGPAHKMLALLEQTGHLSAVVTQNIDGLHQMAGSKNVFELHGSIYRSRCIRCGRKYALPQLLKNKEKDPVPHCSCGGVIKPEVVLYGESLDEETLLGSIDAIRQADLLIVGGSSLTVYPAAGLLHYYRGRRLVLINKTPTPQDESASLLFREGIGPVLTGAVRLAGIGKEASNAETSL